MELIIQQPSAFSFVYVRYDKIENRNDHIKETRQEIQSKAFTQPFDNHIPSFLDIILDILFLIMNCLDGVVERGHSTSYSLNPNRSLDRNKRVIKEFVFLFHPSPPLFRHLAAVRVSP